MKNNPKRRKRIKTGWRASGVRRSALWRTQGPHGVLAEKGARGENSGASKETALAGCRMHQGRLGGQHCLITRFDKATDWFSAAMRPAETNNCQDRWLLCQDLRISKAASGSWAVHCRDKIQRWTLSGYRRHSRSNPMRFMYISFTTRREFWLLL